MSGEWQDCAMDSGGSSRLFSVEFAAFESVGGPHSVTHSLEMNKRVVMVIAWGQITFGRISASLVL
jgi:hypothetical protein